MKSRLQRALQTWVEREAASPELTRDDEREAAAERALRRVFERLPLHGPSAGFADRVLARAGVALAAPTALPAWLPRPVFRAFTAVCLVLAGLATAFVPRALVVLSPDLGWGGWISRGVELVTGAAQHLVGTFATWETLVGVGSTLADIIVSPTLVAVMTASLFVSFVAMRALHGLIVPAGTVR